MFPSLYTRYIVLWSEAIILQEVNGVVYFCLIYSNGNAI